MSLVERVSEQMKEALKARDAQRLAALRGIRAGLLNEMKKDNSKDLADPVAEAVLRRLEKQRKESIEAFELGGRPDRAEEERSELRVIQSFLPSLADDATTRGWVKAAIATTGASKPGDVGRVMGLIMKEHKGEVDGNLAKQIATQLLGGA
jgi:uncharacterized protein YqeY